MLAGPDEAPTGLRDAGGGGAAARGGGGLTPPAGSTVHVRSPVPYTKLRAPRRSAAICEWGLMG